MAQSAYAATEQRRSFRASRALGAASAFLAALIALLFAAQDLWRYQASTSQFPGWAATSQARWQFASGAQEMVMVVAFVVAGIVLLSGRRLNRAFVASGYVASALAIGAALFALTR